jgi:hypothetical protein
VISSLELVKQDSTTRHVGLTKVPGAVSYVFEGVSGERYNVNLCDGFVYEIRLGAPGLSLEEVLNEFGHPDSVYATRRPNQHAIYDYYEVLLFYPDLGIYMITSQCAAECDATLFSGDGVYVGSEMASWRFSFFEPGPDLHTVLTQSLLLMEADADKIVAAAVPWEGADRHYPAVRWEGIP